MQQYSCCLLFTYSFNINHALSEGKVSYGSGRQLHTDSRKRLHSRILVLQYRGKTPYRPNSTIAILYSRNVTTVLRCGMCLQTFHVENLRDARYLWTQFQWSTSTMKIFFRQHVSLVLFFVRKLIMLQKTLPLFCNLLIWNALLFLQIRYLS